MKQYIAPAILFINNCFAGAVAEVDLARLLQQPDIQTLAYTHACIAVSSPFPFNNIQQQSLRLTQNNLIPTDTTEVDCLAVHHLVQDWVRSSGMRNIPGLDSLYLKKVIFDYFAGCLPLAVFFACEQLASKHIATLASVYSAGLGYWIAAKYRPRLAYGHNDEWVRLCKENINRRLDSFIWLRNTAPQYAHYETIEPDNHTQLYIPADDSTPEQFMSIMDLNKGIWRQYNQSWNDKFKPALDAALDQQQQLPRWGYGLGILIAIDSIASRLLKEYLLSE